MIGSGFLKGNISAQVGAVYPRDDAARRTRGFVIFSMAIDFGAVAGPLLTGLLAQLYGWHYGFGSAALFMLAGPATYLSGYRHLPARVDRRRHEGGPLTRGDWRVIVALCTVMAITIFQLIDPLFSILGVPVLFWVSHRQSVHRGEPGDLAKIGTGAWLAATSNMILVVAILGADGAPVHPVRPFLYCAGMGIAFLYHWPTLLALVSRAAPASVNATMMGVAFMSLFVANNLIGWIGGFYEKMSPAEFWALHAAIGATGVLVMLFGGRLSRAPASQPAQPLRPSAQTLAVER